MSLDNNVYDKPLITDSSNISGVIYGLTPGTSGVQVGQVQGNTAQPIALEIVSSYQLDNQASNVVTVPEGNSIRRIIFLDTQTNVNDPPPSDVLETATFTSMLNIGNMSRFFIIEDTIIDINPTCVWPKFATPTVFLSSQNVKSFSSRIDLRHLPPIKYENPDPITHAQRVTSNNIYMIIIAANVITIEYEIQTRLFYSCLNPTTNTQNNTRTIMNGLGYSEPFLQSASACQGGPFKRLRDYCD